MIYRSIVTLLLPFILCWAKKPNVLLIVCDDLNGVETLGGHPQTKLPYPKTDGSGVSFTQAHCNIPICNPSRASFATNLSTHLNSLALKTGIKMVKNCTMMDHLEKWISYLGYCIMHNRDRRGRNTDIL